MKNEFPHVKPLGGGRTHASGLDRRISVSGQENWPLSNGGAEPETLLMGIHRRDSLAGHQH